MSTLSSANVTDVSLVLKERTHMRICLNMLIFTHNLDNWLIHTKLDNTVHSFRPVQLMMMTVTLYFSGPTNTYLKMKVCANYFHIHRVLFFSYALNETKSKM